MEVKHKFDNEEEVLGMGGPWIGHLYINNKHVSNNILVDNVLYSLDNTRVFFVKYHCPTKWRKDVFFTICYQDFTINTLFESITRFEMIFLKGQVNEATITVCNSLHGKFKDNCYDMNLNDLGFQKATMP